MSLKANYRVNPNLEILIEAETQKALFWQLAATDDVFGFAPCKRCGSEDTRFYVRKVIKGKKTFEFPERRCFQCSAVLKYSLNVEGGTMYAVRKTSDGKWDTEFGGWSKFNPSEYNTENGGNDEEVEEVKPAAKGKKRF
jgi:hypothetical protein